ncbi:MULTISPECIES: zinc-dependent alcohol dehydrogenase family protein [unclassified Pseudomonas]|jgi:NADPH2:quinone reductase|uniref:zinc-dependent alcohol dehydrogenase family protein n=1 Tax=unclassified Pseudomonas TaxID=196821 RepID=UPI002553C38D|nr:zinc-dependent alcohol dehydrogenase family protein [Pseudomonas sp. efr-133-TYG-103a]
MSRAIKFHRFGKADVLSCEEQPDRLPGPQEVLVRAEAIGISWDDVLWRQNLALAEVRLPAGLGSEMAGIVEAVGADVTDLNVGDKVASFKAMSANQYPVCGDHVLVPRNALTRYPQTLTPTEASVHYTPMLLAYFAFVDLAKVQPGQTVLITDATYSPGIAFVQLGKALGLRVIAATQHAEDREYLLANGAERVIVTDEDDICLRIDAVTQGQGIEAVFDGLGGMQMSMLGDVLAPRGSLVLYGLRGGNKTPFPALQAFRKNMRFFVHCLENFTGKPEAGIEQDGPAMQRALQVINDLTAKGLLQPDIHRTWPFEQFGKAHNHLDDKPVRGRVVLTVR